MKTVKDKKVYCEGDSIKYIFLLKDDSVVEMAVFVHNGQTHFCVSTQVGCPVGCRHCATTYAQVQYHRNLEKDELCEMIGYALEQEQSQRQRILSFSGHGEPLLNWRTVSAVKDFFRNEFDQIYITTIGNERVLRQIAEERKTDIVFYFSLHGSTDEERKYLIPKADSYSTIGNLFEFTRTYTEYGGKVVFNYMLHKQNSDSACLDRLIRLLSGSNQNVSIRFTDFNQIEHATNILGLMEAERAKVLSYIESARVVGEKWSYRYSRLEGNGIQIACGQLRATIIKETEDKYGLFSFV